MAESLEKLFGYLAPDEALSLRSAPNRAVFAERFLAALTRLCHDDRPEARAFAQSLLRRPEARP